MLAVAGSVQAYLRSYPLAISLGSRAHAAKQSSHAMLSTSLCTWDYVSGAEHSCWP